MQTRTASAEWYGDLAEGSGIMRLGSGAFEGDYSFDSRFSDGLGTNPEELIGAAYAGCYSMELSGQLEKSGHKPERVFTKARVQLERQGEAFRIALIELETHANVPNIDEAEFQQRAKAAHENCPVSVALKATKTTLKAILD